MLEATDRFTHYGLIGAAWVHQGCVEHFVLSCRALGLGIEESFLAALARQLAAEGRTSLSGRLVPTDANLACRQVFSRNGFAPVDGNPALWSRSLATPLPLPPHLALV